jgi:ferredoxin-NADP reductase
MYPLLGECLLQAIFSVLGDVASGDVVRAWRDAYWWLAEKLIFEETKLLSNQVANNHGWEGFRSFVVRKHIESESICSVYLFPVDGALPLPEFAAGQYVTLRLRLLDGFITHRNYSLSDCGKKHYFRISVKRLPGGEASCFIHDSLRSGDIIDVSIPSGTFTLHKYLKTPRAERGPIVFICAGIGMTPLLSMMYSLYNESSLGYQGDGPHHNTTSIDSKNSNESLEAASVNTQKEIDLSPHSVGTQTKVFVDNDFLPRSESPVLFLHAAKNKRHDCLVEELFSFAATHPNCRVYKVYSLPRPNVDVFGKDYHYAGHIDAHLLRYLLGDAVTRCTFYLCGPDRFMEAQFTNIVNVGGNQDNIYYERFAAGSGTLLRN